LQEKIQCLKHLLKAPGGPSIHPFNIRFPRNATNGRTIATLKVAYLPPVQPFALTKSETEQNNKAEVALIPTVSRADVITADANY